MQANPFPSVLLLLSILAIVAVWSQSQPPIPTDLIDLEDFDLGCEYQTERAILDFPAPPSLESLLECPSGDVVDVVNTDSSYNVTVNSTTNYTVTQTRTSVTGRIGLCGSYLYPRSDAEVGTLERSFIMTFVLPWCNEVFSFRECLEERPDRWFPPAYAVNRRPFTTHLPVFNSNPPMWDTGGYFYRTVTVRVDDSCRDIENQLFFAQPRFLLEGINTTYSLYQRADRNVSLVYMSSRIFPGFIDPAFDITATEETCFLAPHLQCDEPNRTRPIEVFPSEVRLACFDPDYGYVWRIDNDIGPNLHYDWRIERLADGSLVDASQASGIVVPGDISARNKRFNETFENGFWPGTSGKHTALSLNHFYVPTYLDDPGNVTRPSRLLLYAGRPDYYNETTTNAALVAFFDLADLLQFDALNMSSMSPFNYSMIETKFDADFERQGLYMACNPPSAVPMNAMMASNMTQDWVPFCDAVREQNTTWSDMLQLVNDTFGPAAFASSMAANATNATAANMTGPPDPMPECSCQNLENSDCGDDGPFATFRFQYDYILRENRTVVLEYEPACRMPVFGEDNNTVDVSNLPDLSYFYGNTTPVVEDTIDITRSISNLLGTWPLPNTVNTETVIVDGSPVEKPDELVYSTAPLGVLWKAINNNTADNAAPINIRQEIVNLDENSSVTDTAVPFSPTDDYIVGPNRTRWFFSRSLTAHRIYGNVNWPCNALGCPAGDPADPPSTSGLDPFYLTSPFFAFIDESITLAEVQALPLCECRVNAPCNLTELVFDTPYPLDFSELLPPPPPPGVVPTAKPLDSCVPETEFCDCTDSNCDGFIDNPLGLGDQCGYTDVGRCEYGTLACEPSQCLPGSTDIGRVRPLVCDGYVSPELEKCDNQDWNCDGVPNNVPRLGEPCGSDVGVCERGVLQCDPPNPEPVCAGAVEPLVFDICDDGLDNDCNGLIDDNCVVVSPPGGGPSLPPPPPPGTSPPTAPAGPAPSGQAPDGGPLEFIDFPEFDVHVVTSPGPYIAFIIFFLVWCVLFCLWICRRRIRRYYKRRIIRRF